MPVLVQWKWKERTKTFVAIFHFYDDGRKPNLRLNKRRFVGGFDRSLLRWLVLPPQEPILSDEFERLKEKLKLIDFEKATMTWAPSHPETGLVTEVLSYANIINGLKEWKKRELIPKLEVSREELQKDEVIDELEKLEDKTLLSGYEGKLGKNWLNCVELCPEYIDYLKKILKPYLKD